MTDYEKQGTDFLKLTATTIEIKPLGLGKHWPGDKHDRDIYSVTLSRNGRSFTFKFGQSIQNSAYFWRYGNYERGMSNGIGKNHHKPTPLNEWDHNKDRSLPTAYGVLTCLTTCDPGDLENFCADFGYDLDSRTAEKTHKAVVNEYTQLCTLYNTAEMEQLAEIN